MPESEEQQSSITADRDEAGRFPAGVSGNPAGRPKGSKNLKRALEESVREYIANPARIKRVHKVIDRLFQQAEDGDVGAAKLLLDKIVPNAKDEVEDHSGANQNTYVFRIENATFAAQQKQLPHQVPLTVPVEVIEVKEETK